MVMVASKVADKEYNPFSSMKLTPSYIVDKNAERNDAFPLLI
jgi:hypothetical protein